MGDTFTMGAGDNFVRDKNDLHPYACDENCIHCNSIFISDHDPDNCDLCKIYTIEDDFMNSEGGIK